MELSPRAQAWLQRQQRFRPPGERAQIIQALQDAGLPVFEPVVQFEEQFGGLSLPAASVEFGLWQSDPKEVQGEFDDESGHWSFVCAEMTVAAPDNYSLDEEGWLYFGGAVEAPSMGMYNVERRALWELGGKRPRCYRFRLPAVPREDRPRVDACMSVPVVEEASDAHTTYWLDDRTYAHRTHWFAGHDDVWVYAERLEDARRLYLALTDATQAKIEPIQEDPPPKSGPREM